MRFVILIDEHLDKYEKETVESIEKVLSSINEVKIMPFAPKVIVNDLQKDDVVLNLAVGQRHDFAQGFIAAMLEAANIRFVGSPAYTHYVCLDKFTTKSILSAYGISTPPGAIFDGEKINGEIPNPPLMVKPTAEGSGIGVDKFSLCEDKEDAINIAKNKYDLFKEPILIEKYVEGKEITVGVIGSKENKIEVLPPLEIDFSRLPEGIEKYYSKRVKEEYAAETLYRCPPSDLSKKELEFIKDIAIKAFKILKARDFIRMDMRISDGIPYIIEVNSRPGLHPEMSDIPKMIKPLSKNYDWLIKKLIERFVPSKEV